MDTGKGVDTTVLKPVCAQRTCRRQAIGHCSVTFASMFFLVCWAKLFGYRRGVAFFHGQKQRRRIQVLTGQHTGSAYVNVDQSLCSPHVSSRI